MKTRAIDVEHMSDINNWKFIEINKMMNEMARSEKQRILQVNVERVPYLRFTVYIWTYSDQPGT
jgi:hypothetical protein